VALKRSVFPIVLAAFVAGCSAFSQGKPQPKPNPYAGPPRFVREEIPEGKAIVYIYYTGSVARAPLLLADSGPLAVLHLGRTDDNLFFGSYFPYVVDPGKVRLWMSCTNAATITVDVTAGQEYFVKFDIDAISQAVSLQIVPAMTAKTKEEVLYCAKTE
jgi:hypothetical protein